MEFILPLLQKYPVVITVLSVIGGLRLILKPLFALAHAVADVVPGDKDDAAIKAVEDSKVMKGFLFAIDWIASVKLK